MVTRKDDPMVVSLVDFLNKSVREVFSEDHPERGSVIEFTPILPMSTQAAPTPTRSLPNAVNLEVLCEAAECSLNLCGERALALHYLLHRVRLSLMSIRAEMRDTHTKRPNPSSIGGETTPTDRQPALISRASIENFAHLVSTMGQFIVQLGSDMEQANDLLMRIARTVDVEGCSTNPKPPAA